MVSRKTINRMINTVFKTFPVVKRDRTLERCEKKHSFKRPWFNQRRKQHTSLRFTHAQTDGRGWTLSDVCRSLRRSSRIPVGLNTPCSSDGRWWTPFYSLPCGSPCTRSTAWSAGSCGCCSSASQNLCRRPPNAPSLWSLSASGHLRINMFLFL